MRYTFHLVNEVHRRSNKVYCRPRRPAQALNTSFGGGTGDGGSGYAGLGGDGDDSDNPDGPEKKGILVRWQGWQERVAADPSFPYKVFIEQVRLLGACNATEGTGVIITT